MDYLGFLPRCPYRYVLENEGFGPQNLRAVGIVFIASLVAILSLARASDLTTAMGIFGAIAGYLFGSQRASEREGGDSSSVAADGATIGPGAKVAGRDINETLNRIVGDIDEIKDSVVHMNQGSVGDTEAEFLFVSNYQDDGEPLAKLSETIIEMDKKGWTLKAVFPSYDKRGLIGLFRRAVDSQDAGPLVRAVYHGNEENRLA